MGQIPTDTDKILESPRQFEAADNWRPNHSARDNSSDYQYYSNYAITSVDQWHRETAGLGDWSLELS